MKTTDKATFYTPMTPRQRLLTVLQGQQPDRVPWFADLSHWYNHHRGISFVPGPENKHDLDIVELHREVGAGLYLNTGRFAKPVYDGAVTESSWLTAEGVYVFELKTPIGTLQEHRVFSEQTYSYHIRKLLIESLDDLAIVEYAMKCRYAIPDYGSYHVWAEADRSLCLPYATTGYAGLGFLLSRYMGVERTILAVYDAPHRMARVMRVIDQAKLREIDVLIQSPSPVVFHSDNITSDVFSPTLFAQYAAGFYCEMCRRVHAAGKFVAVHVDGRLRGALKFLGECGVDVIDAVTPTPMGDLTPEACREEAGDMILCGGIPATVWDSSTSDYDFEACVKRWLGLRRFSPRLVLAPGDQVPPGVRLERIEWVSRLVDEFGRYG